MLRAPEQRSRAASGPPKLVFAVKWEYRVESGPGVDHGETSQLLNAAGAAGWELVAVVPPDMRGTTAQIFLKRPRAQRTRRLPPRG